MYISKEKKAENIAEYVLYMWHVEDVVRACNFSMDLIKPNLIEPMAQTPEQDKELEAWYADFISKMKEAKIEKNGHLPELNEIIIELLYLHNMLLNVNQDKEYGRIVRETDPFIKEFSVQSKTATLNPVEVCLNGQYAKLLLKLQKKEISEETEAAFAKFKEMLRYLALKYREINSGSSGIQNN